ncbi:MAG: hypothetical protein R3C08_14835 [Hyphomonas sp.]
MRMVIAMAAAMTAVLLPASADVSSLTAEQRAQYDAKLAQCISEKTKSTSRTSISTIEKNAIRKACEATALAAVTAGPAVAKGSVPLGGGLPGSVGVPVGEVDVSGEEVTEALARQAQLSSLTNAVRLQIPVKISGLPSKQELFEKWSDKIMDLDGATDIELMVLCSMSMQEGNQQYILGYYPKKFPYSQSLDEVATLAVPDIISTRTKSNPYEGSRIADILQHPDHKVYLWCTINYALHGPNRFPNDPYPLGFIAAALGREGVAPVTADTIWGTYGGGEWKSLERRWNTENPPAGVTFVRPGVEQIVPAVEGQP